MAFDKKHHIHLQNGKFATTTVADLDAAFDAYAAENPRSGWVLHFHGGLNNRQAGEATAAALLPAYESARAYPFFFIWESGAWETVRNNLADIAGESFFQKIVTTLMDYLVPRLGGGLQSSAESLGSPEQLAPGAARERVQQWFREADGTAPYEELRSELLDRDLPIQVDPKEIESYLAADVGFQDELNRLVISSGAESKMSRSAVREMVEPPAEELFGIGATFGAAAVFWRIAKRTVGRFFSRRDHGLYTTVVEEVLRELYVDKLGSTFFWNQMKKDTADAFGADPAQHGGTAFLKCLQKSLVGQPSAPRITLVGHSAGAIYVANFLIAAHRMLPSNVNFDVILLAPAVEFELWSAAALTGRVRDIRQFGLSDPLEAQDALLQGVSPLLKAFYPKSLLYFVSGLLETEVDRPLVGMQRYYDANRYPSGAFPAVNAVRDYFARPGRTVWSVAHNGPGQQSTSRRHGHFDREDPATLESVLHVVRDGFGSEVPLLPDEGLPDAPASPRGAAGLHPASLDVVESMQQSQYVQINSHQIRAALDTLSPENLEQLINDLPKKPKAAVNAVAPSEQIRSLVDQARKSNDGYTQLLFRANQVEPRAGLVAQYMPGAVQKVDPQFADAFRARQAEQFESVRGPSDLEGMVEPRAVALPMLISVDDDEASLDDVPELKIMSRIGRIVAAKGTEASLRRLQRHPRVVSVEQSDEGEELECINSMRFIEVIDANTQQRTAEQGDQALIAVIDGGIDVLHGAFQDAQNKTRIHAIWDQTDNGGPAPPGFANVGGTLHTEDDINNYIASGQVGKNLGRDAFSGHGTHVASIAAGTPNPNAGFPGGVAPQAKLIVVITGRSKYEPGAPDSLGYSVSHVAALKFVDEMARQLDLPVVVNLSQGKNSGAHDGKSLLEISFDEFSQGGRKPGRIVVKSAGNDRQGKGHAFVTLGNQGFEHLDWISAPATETYQRRQDVLELWFEPVHELAFELVNPSAELTPKADWTNRKVSGSFQTGNTFAVDYSRRHPDNGQSRLRIRVTNGTAKAIETGKWMLRVTAGALTSDAQIDAWVDKTDWLPVSFINHLEEERTLSVPGTANSVIAVGAVTSSAPPVIVGDFSAFGKTRDGRNKPEIVAPGVEVQAARSMTSFGLLPKSGTSMAAPHVTGAIAVSMSAHKKAGHAIPNANQMNSALIDSTNYRNANWNRGSGYGVLNVDALLKQTPIS